MESLIPFAFVLLFIVSILQWIVQKDVRHLWQEHDREVQLRILMRDELLRELRVEMDRMNRQISFLNQELRSRVPASRFPDA